MILDKRDVLPKIDGSTLELGCGNRRRIPDAITIDRIDYDCVDIVGEVFEVLEQIPDNCIQRVYSSHFFEHIENLPLLMNHLTRILKAGGILHAVVPHFSNPYFYSDLTHKTSFGLYTFSYLVNDSLFKRKVPQYSKPFPFSLSRVRLIFKSSPPFYFRYIFKKGLEYIFNLHRGIQELYEENLCYFFPCYEICFEMKRLNNSPAESSPESIHDGFLL